jgi:hypothetical protein
MILELTVEKGCGVGELNPRFYRPTWNGFKRPVANRNIRVKGFQPSTRTVTPNVPIINVAIIVNSPIADNANVANKANDQLNPYPTRCML